MRRRGWWKGDDDEKEMMRSRIGTWGEGGEDDDDKMLTGGGWRGLRGEDWEEDWGEDEEEEEERTRKRTKTTTAQQQKPATHHSNDVEMRAFCELFFGDFAFLQQLLQKRSPLLFEGGSSGQTAIAADAHDVSNVAGHQVLGNRRQRHDKLRYIKYPNEVSLESSAITIIQCPSIDHVTKQFCMTNIFAHNSIFWVPWQLWVCPLWW